MNKINYYLLFLIIVFLNIHCNSNSGDSLFINEKLLKEYNDQYKNIKVFNSSDSSHIDFYLDLTYGLKVAFLDTNTKSFFENVVNSLRFNQINFYRVANDTVIPFQDVNKSDIYNTINNPGSFTKAFAPLDMALKRIIENNSQAIYVTDGELWDKAVGESNRPWAREYFAEWLRRGNLIYFYITDHTDAGKQKHIFYMLFVPRNMINSPQNVTKDINYTLKNNIIAHNLRYTPFAFANTLYQFEQNYKNIKSGGADEMLAINSDSYIINKESLFEYEEVTVSWNDIVEYIKNGIDDKTGNPIPGGKHILRNVFINNSDNQFYDIQAVDIKVYNIYKDYADFVEYKHALELKPKLISDQSGNKVLNVSDPNYDEISQYYDNNGNMFPSKKYNPGNLSEIKELFVFDTVLFSNTYKSNKRGEIGIKVHPNFDGTQISPEGDNLFKIDIIVKNAVPITSSLLSDKFIWEGKKLSKNQAMYSSIINALNDANLSNGTILYTFYIRTL